MGKFIKRKIKLTTADVYDENGDRLGTMQVRGFVTAPRMANIARRDNENQLLTVRNVAQSEDVYIMDEDTFIQHADIMGSVDEEEPQE